MLSRLKFFRKKYDGMRDFCWRRLAFDHIRISGFPGGQLYLINLLFCLYKRTNRNSFCHGYAHYRFKRLSAVLVPRDQVCRCKMSVVINIVPGNLCLIVKSFTKRFFFTILAGSHYDYLVIILSLYSWSAGGINKSRIKEIAAVSFCRCQAYV